MHIHAEDVLLQMERQMGRIAKAVKDNDGDELKEAAAVLESYCQLLKGHHLESRLQQEKTKPISYPLPVQKRVPETKELGSPLAETEGEQEEKRNLLDF
ncbi:Uncharacterised protein [Niallia circulans]|uniref:YwdI family protein n=1 Tax=Shouchella clausii TaxID=79880 RepID=UPI000BA56883|nr:YwdI family protein [Shouchella clausii]MCM3547988.1 YwdI family protein [Shouchella clausii]PAF15183.1 hypothetical protein CHH59_04895 [Shouchella clausii]SPU18001.1 Uncharacterised protein [Niallia circulans]